MTVALQDSVSLLRRPSDPLRELVLLGDALRRQGVVRGLTELYRGEAHVEEDDRLWLLRLGGRGGGEVTSRLQGMGYYISGRKWLCIRSTYLPIIRSIIQGKRRHRVSKLSDSECTITQRIASYQCFHFVSKLIQSNFSQQVLYTKVNIKPELLTPQTCAL